MSNRYPANIPEGRLHDDTNWADLAMAYDTWHECMEYARENGVSELDPDVLEYVRHTFATHQLWDFVKGEPMLAEYLNLLYHRC